MKENLISAKINRIIEDYLSRLYLKLKTIPKSERQEIIKEIQSDILTEVEIKKREGTHEETEILFCILENLGKPEDVAAEILSKRLISFRGNFVKRFISFTIRNYFTAFLGFLSSIFTFCLYFFGFLFVAMACAKPFFPSKVGLFGSKNGFGGFGIIIKKMLIGIDGYNPRGEEILGFWVIPFGLFSGLLLLFLANIILLRLRKLSS